MDTPELDPSVVLWGEIVTWDMNAFEIPLSTVLAGMTAAGLPLDDKALRMQARTAFGRAVRDLREGRTIDRVATDKQTGIITFQFTRKGLDAAGLHLAFDYEALCTLDKNTGQINCPDSPAIEAHARTMFQHALDHRTTSDVTRLVQRLFAKNADLYPINRKKGVAYFVPEAYRDFSAKVDDFLHGVGGWLDRFPVPRGTEHGNRAVARTLEDGLNACIAELQEAVDGWDDSTRESTFDRAIERWQLAKHKTESLAEALGDRQAALLAHLDAQKTRLAARVAELTALKEATKDAKTHHDGNGQRTLFPGAVSAIHTETVTA
jgi:hypothetical protein